jgi:phage-related baseplate assembly protein
MNLQTALLNDWRMGEAGRLSVATGTPATKLMENADNVVQQHTSAQSRIGRLH